MDKIDLEKVGRNDGLTLSALIHSFRNTEWLDGWEVLESGCSSGKRAETPLSEAKAGPGTHQGHRP